MSQASILLLKPSGDQPSPVDQSLGSRLAATVGRFSKSLDLEQDSFRRGDLSDLERSLGRWVGKVSGVVGSTSVPESTRLGQLAEQLDLLCFVANNNPAVWEGRSHVFHLGVPTSLTSHSVAQYLVRDLGARRVTLLHDDTEFQSLVASRCETFLREAGAEVRSFPGCQNGWAEDVKSWAPDVLYLVYSDEGLAVPMIQGLRAISKNLPVLLGRSLLRQSFLSSLGELAEGLLLLDLFSRGRPRNEPEENLTRVLSDSGINVPTANHGFGWDAMTLCGKALVEAEGDPRSAICYLESGVQLEGATGYYRFNPEDHNGRSAFNPTTLSLVRNARVEAHPKIC
jgi:ABC-type branched-subunit amino acid transport system substrate-binding protein